MKWAGVIASGEAIPLRGLEGVPGLPGAQTQVVSPAHFTPRQTALWAVFEHRRAQKDGLSAPCPVCPPCRGLWGKADLYPDLIELGLAFASPAPCTVPAAGQMLSKYL